MTSALASRSALSRGAAVAASALLLLAGCHRRLPVGTLCSVHGGEGWREYRSAHFRLSTDFDRGWARAGLERLERIRALVVAAVPGGAREVPGYVRVVVPATDATYSALNERQVAGYFTMGVLGEPTIVLPAWTWKRDPEVIAHELAHQVMLRDYPRPPRWFSEGLAQFVETVARDGESPAAGRVPATRVADLPRARRVMPGDLPAWRERAPAKDEAVLELWSWILYGWLRSEREAQLLDYQRRLGRFEDPERAWTGAFPEFDPSDPEAMARLERRLDVYRRKGGFRAFPVSGGDADAGSTAVDPGDRVLSSADVHVLVLDVGRSLAGGAAHGAGRPAADAAANLAQALREDPLHPVALAMRAAEEKSSAVEAIRASTSERPGDWRGWLLLGMALPREDRDGRESAFRRAIDLEPESGLAHLGLATVLWTGQRWDDALPEASRAVALLPSNADAAALYALATARVGGCEEASLMEQLAERLRPAVEEDDEKRAAAIRDRCGPPRLR